MDSYDPIDKPIEELDANELLAVSQRRLADVKGWIVARTLAGNGRYRQSEKLDFVEAYISRLHAMCVELAARVENLSKEVTIESKTETVITETPVNDSTDNGTETTVTVETETVEVATE